MGYKFDSDEKYSMFFHHINASEDDKMLRLRTKHGNDAYALYFIVLEMIYTQFEPKYVCDRDGMILLSKRTMIASDKLRKIIKEAADINLFDYTAWNTHKVLTSTAIKYWWEFRNRQNSTASTGFYENRHVLNQQIMTPKQIKNALKDREVPVEEYSLYQEVNSLVYDYDERPATLPEKRIFGNWITKYGKEQVEEWIALSKHYLGQVRLQYIRTIIKNNGVVDETHKRGFDKYLAVKRREKQKSANKYEVLAEASQEDS